MDPVGPFPSQMLGMLGRQHLMGTLGDRPGNVDGQCLAVRRCTPSLSSSLNSPLASEPSGGPLGRRPGAPGEDDAEGRPCGRQGALTSSARSWSRALAPRAPLCSSAATTSRGRPERPPYAT